MNCAGVIHLSHNQLGLSLPCLHLHNTTLLLYLIYETYFHPISYPDTLSIPAHTTSYLAICCWASPALEL